VQRDRGAGDGIYVSLMCLLFEKTRPDILARKKAEAAVKSAVFK
jgi:hypothetical protein